MTRWETLFRYAAYVALLVLGARWIGAAIAGLQQPAFGSDALPGHEALVVLAKGAGLRVGALYFAAAVIGVKLVMGVYLVFVVGVAAARHFGQGHTDDKRLDRALLLSVLAVMLYAGPLLIRGVVMPGVIDDLTIAVVGITLSALSKPLFETPKGSGPLGAG